MAEATIEQQLVSYLTDAHSIEQQALPQVRVAPRLAGDQQLASIFRQHLSETEEHERLVRERIEAHGATPSRLKDLVMKAGGVGFALFAGVQPDTPGKLIAHAHSYENLELASYELLVRVAERAGDAETVGVARRIREQEAAMARRLAERFDRAVDASLRAVGRDDLPEQLVKYLADAHALEAQSIRLLQKGADIAGDPELARLYEEHLLQSRDHQKAVQGRLDAHGAGPSRVKDAAMGLGALNWATFFRAQPDTPGKLAAFAFAFENLEIAAYEQLKRVAGRADDQETVAAAERILSDERSIAERIAAHFGRAVDAALAAQGVAA